MTSALLDATLQTATDSAAVEQAAAERSAGEALRQQAAERLAAHRRRRAGMAPVREALEHAETQGRARATQIAAAVAERYAKTQSYHAFLAEEAERAVQQARAAAEMATIKAKAMEAAQQSLLATLDLDTPEFTAGSVAGKDIVDELRLEPEEPRRRTRANAAKATRHERRAEPMPTAAHQSERPWATPANVPSFAVRLENEVALHPICRDSLRENRMFEHEAADMIALDEEIALLHAPELEEFIARSEPLPANLIEFPRQLVASRKARPRLAEGPLRNDDRPSGESQLRIFEVDAAQISTEPVLHDAHAQWSSIYLETPQPAAASSTMSTKLAGTASIARRAKAATINACVIGSALAAFCGTAAYSSGNIDALRSFSAATLLEMLRGHGEGYGWLLASGVVAAAFLCLAYEWLFFTFSDATPGMRYARIGLCTFGDDNPSRRAMRRRVLAIVLSALPFGLGFAWAVFDEEKLSWHDRTCRMYLREY